MELKAKRPPNAYLLYSEAMREQIKKENPNIKPNELTKLIANKYKNEPKEVLQQYIDLAKKKQEEFKAQHPDYQYSRASTKKKPQTIEDVGDPIQAINQRFLSNPFTFQCISSNTK